MREELEQARAVKGLSIYLLNSELAAKVTDAIRDVVTSVLAGEVRSGIHDQKYADATTVMQYRDALRELFDMIPSSGRT